MVIASQSAGGWRKPLLRNALKSAARKLAAFFVFGFVIIADAAIAQENPVWQVGRFSFSDELGGFKITGVSGTGTRRDPFYIRQIFTDPNEATLVIRTHAMNNVASLPNNNVTHSAIHLYIETVNDSSLAWIGFGFELQEELDKPSTYGDGLSFDQLSRSISDISSDRFARFEEQFEPGDRLVYLDGFVDAQTKVTTRFVVTDFTPVPEFYLYQKPLVPAS